MTTFKQIRGTDILALSSDPANPEIGQIWYNSSSGTLKGYQFATINAWSAGGNLISSPALAKRGGAGTQTAALAFGGQPTGSSNSSESYNGTSWTATPTLNTTRSALGGAGNSNTAALAFGGYLPPTTTATESFNGSAWTTVNSLSQRRNAVGALGIQTAAVAFGGYIQAPNVDTNSSESWNGTSWTTTSSLNTTRESSAGFGTQTAGIGAGGYTYPGGGYRNVVESFNGSAWTNIASLPTATGDMFSGGTATAGIVAGGNTPSVITATLFWNGSAWTSNPSGLATARGGGTYGPIGTQSAALAAGGETPVGNSSSTEEWNTQLLAIRTITVS